MTILLDTHSFLWFWWADSKLSTTATAVISDPSNRKLVRPASSWEIAIKVSLKKLDLGLPFRGYIHSQMLKNNFELLPISDEHLTGLSWTHPISSDNDRNWTFGKFGNYQLQRYLFRN